jgi:hypothetical protein
MFTFEAMKSEDEWSMLPHLSGCAPFEIRGKRVRRVVFSDSSTLALF